MNPRSADMAHTSKRAGAMATKPGWVDGSLRNRMKKGKAFRNVRAKTGAITGISTLAGYVKAANGHMLAFSIMNQNVLKLSEARSFQDKVCEILAN